MVVSPIHMFYELEAPTVKDTRAGNLIGSQTTPCACTAETAMSP